MKDTNIKETIFIPKTIKCGFKLRFVKNDYYVERSVKNEDGEWEKVWTTDEPTYKMGFVSYYDEKGKFRHETSFEGWRNHHVPTEEHENVPTKGFKFFKQANRFTWNRFCSYRNVVLEVQDPRGWVFEITHNNLAWIIDNCNINKGDIDGEFVYGWDGKDRVLIPCSSDTYKDLVEFSKKLNNNKFIQPKDLKPFHIYKSRQGESMLYVGRFDVYEHRREDRAKERNLMNTFEREGWFNIGHEKEYLYAKYDKKGKYYFFLSYGENSQYAKHVWKDKGLFSCWNGRLKSPKDKFIEDIDFIDDEELQKEIATSLFNRHESLHTIDYSSPYKYYLTAEDFIAYKNIELEDDSDRLVLWSLRPYSDYCSDSDEYKLNTRWRRDENINEWFFEMEVKEGWWSKKNVKINLHEFVEKFKPYYIYHKYDDGTVGFVHDSNGKFEKWLIKENNL